MAVKTLKPGSSENDRVRFLQEAAIIGQFSHPHVVKLYGVVTVGDPVSIYCSLIIQPTQFNECIDVLDYDLYGADDQR